MAIYEKQVWRDDETGGTPITADRLNHMEDGIEENSKNWDSISHSERIAIESNANASDGLVSYRCGNDVKLFVKGLSLKNQLNAWSSRTVATLPSGLEPQETIFASITTDNGPAVVGIKNDGAITVESRANTLKPNLNMYGSISWFI